MKNIYESLIKNETKLSVIGLGYVGLPIALEFARKMPVIGFDIREDRVQLMKNNIDPSEELVSSDFEGCDIVFTSKPEDLKEATFHIVAVPTPIDDSNMPDLKPLLSATRTVGKVLKKGDYVVYESTVYPGATEEDCIPILEELSGLKFVEDFKVGFSPERINPGDKVNTLTTIKKIVSGCDDESLDIIAKVYELIIKAGIHRASCIKVAEAAKIIENTQRDINIAFMNELSILFNRLGINTYEVLEAAGTKWNFLKFYPGLVGGHCIGVDPYYLVYKASKVRFHTNVIKSGRAVNDSMGFYIAKQTVKKMIASGKNILQTRVLILGATFKEDVADIRNSRVPDIFRELKSYGVNAEMVDPHANVADFKHEYDIQLSDYKAVMDNTSGSYDAIIVAVSHIPFKDLNYDFFRNRLKQDGILVDVKGMYRAFSKTIPYWSL